MAFSETHDDITLVIIINFKSNRLSLTAAQPNKDCTVCQIDCNGIGSLLIANLHVSESELVSGLDIVIDNNTERLFTMPAFEGVGALLTSLAYARMKRHEWFLYATSLSSQRSGVACNFGIQFFEKREISQEESDHILDSPHGYVKVGTWMWMAISDLLVR